MQQINGAVGGFPEASVLVVESHHVGENVCPDEKKRTNASDKQANGLKAFHIGTSPFFFRKKKIHICTELYIFGPLFFFQKNGHETFFFFGQFFFFLLALKVCFFFLLGAGAAMLVPAARTARWGMFFARYTCDQRIL